MDGDFKKEVIDRSIEDIKVEFDEEFDRNFERKAFFDEKEWPERKFDDGVGSLLQRTGGEESRFYRQDTRTPLYRHGTQYRPDHSGNNRTEL